MNGTTSVGKRLQNLDIGPEFDTYTRVIIHAGQTTDAEGKTTALDYIAGNENGRTLEITDPLGTQAKANALLARLQNSKFQYQPYTADNALLDPAAELGDGITLSDTFSAIYTRDVRYSALMAAKLEAPSDEEIDHEYPFIPKQERVYKRETAHTRSALRINENAITAEVSRATEAEGNLSANITINADAITAEVQRATGAEGNLSSSITQNANAITAEVRNRQTAITGLNQELTTKIQQTDTNIRADVVAKTDGNRTSFGWELLSTGWNLYSGNKTVLKATSSGIEVSGKITATSGYIGNGASGFTIGNTAIYNGITSMTDTAHNGLYLGTDGIRLGQGNFNVTKAGVLTAKSGYIGNGTSGFTIGNTYIRNGMTGRDDTTNNGIYLGTDGVALGKGNFKVTKEGAVTAKSGTVGGVTINSSYGLYTNGKTGSTSTATGFFISKDGAIYLGAYNSTLQSCPFQVTASGAATATNLAIKGGSISIKNGNTETFKVTNVGKVTAADLHITGGEIIIKDGSTTTFQVTTKGAVTATNIAVKGGSIAIGSKFSVDTTGNVKASNIEVSGGKITIGSRFSVDTSGNLTATNANLTGKVTASSGKIGGFDIDSTTLTKATADVTTVGQRQYQVMLQAPSTATTSLSAILVRHHDYASGGYGDWVNDFRVQYNGTVTASNFNMNGGTITIKNGNDTTFKVTSLGAVTAANIEIKGGKITIGSRFSVDTSGNLTATNASLSGTVTATNGYIGNGSNGFTIGNTSIRNGVTGMTDTAHNGIYLGTDGIVLGKGYFKVTNTGALTATSGKIGGFNITSNEISNWRYEPSVYKNVGVWMNADRTSGTVFQIGDEFKVDAAGNITANNASLSGTLTIGGTNISASDLRTGAQEAYNGYTGWNGTTATVNDGYSGWNSAATSTSYGGYCYGGATDGYSAYDRVLNAYIGNYRLVLGTGITILGGNFYDSRGGQCSGSASNSAVVTCTYVG